MVSIFHIMSKIHSKYVCQSCAYESPRWIGKCPNCGAWNSFVEEIAPTKSRARGSTPGKKSVAVPITEVAASPEPRIPTRIPELDRVLGGGIVPGSVVLVGGDPGIGKSTLMLQVMIEMAAQGRVLYVSGEESERQVKMRALRLLQDEENGSRPAPEDLYLVTETNMNSILEHVAA